MIYRPPIVRMHGRADGSADFTVDGRPYAELHIPGDQDSTEHARGILVRMMDTAYHKGMSDARAGIRAELGLEK